MAIRPIAPPTDWFGEASATLRRPSGEEPGDPGPLRLSSPVPRYVVGPTTPVTALRGEPASWDGFAFGMSDVGVVSVRVEDGRLRDGSLIVGEFARRALDAAALGDRMLSRGRAIYRPIFIESGSAGLFSLVFLRRRGTCWINIVQGSLVDDRALELRTDLAALLHLVRREAVAIGGGRS